MTKRKILLLIFHPLYHNSRVNRALVEAVDGMEQLTIRHMYDIYPDFHIDVRREQKLLLEHDLIILQHPFYWYSSPSLLKEWLDLVLEHGFAYGSKGHALDRKFILSAVSTGGKRENYEKSSRSRYSVKQLLAPFEQSFTLCRMYYLAPWVTHGTQSLDEAGIRVAASLYRKAVEHLQNEEHDLRDLRDKNYLNEYLNEQ